MKKPAYDLEERSALFGESVIEFCLGFGQTAVITPIISQLVRAATSVGANYCEADDAESKRDSCHKIALCRKESRETKFWCRMIAKAAPASKVEARAMWKETHELHLIFARIVRTTDKNLRAETAKPRS
jgi:four helix bundle protein